MTSLPEHIRIIVGLDLGYHHHQAHGINTAGKRLFNIKLPANSEGLQRLLDLLTKKLGDDDLSQVALSSESPCLKWFPPLFAYGIHLYTINPKQIDAARHFDSSSAAKSDERDSRLLAELLHFRPNNFTAAQPPPPSIKVIRLRHRRLSQLQKALHFQSNALRDNLHIYLPNLLSLCPAADEPWLWEALQAFGPTLCTNPPTLEACRQLLKSNRIRRIKPEELHSALHVGLPAYTDEFEGQALLELVVGHARSMQALHEETRTLRADLDAHMQELVAPETSESDTAVAFVRTDPLCAKAQQDEAAVRRIARLMSSLPGLGSKTFPVLLAMGWPLWVSGDLNRMRAHSGVAPVRESSGKSSRVRMRRACHSELRQALHFAADAFRRVDPRAKALYEKYRQKHKHCRSIRQIGDRFLSVAFSVLKYETPYDPKRRELQTSAG